MRVGSGRAHDVNIALADIAHVTMCTLTVWQVVAEFFKRELQWELSAEIDTVLAEVARPQRIAKVDPRAVGAQRALQQNASVR